MEQNDLTLIIIFITSSLVIGIPIITTSFFVIRRLHELHKTRQKAEGELFVSETGEIFSEFLISIDEMIKKDYILLKVTKVNPKPLGGNDNGNIRTEIHKT